MTPTPSIRSSLSFLFIALTALGVPLGTDATSAVPSDRPRLIVLTDISSLTAAVREPDDGQSMIRLMLYSNELDIEGLIATSNIQHGQVTRPELIREVIAAYAQVRPNLLLHSREYPTAERLLKGVKAGQPVAGLKTSVDDSIGRGKDTEASDWIIRLVDRRDPRPVWVSIWGGSADLAQALWKVRETRTPEDTRSFASKLRVHAVGYQDSTGAWIEREFPYLWFVKHGFSIRGMYKGGDSALSSPEWVDEHVKEKRGPLGALYPNYNGGDIWGAVRGIKEGDTPAFFAILPNGLGHPNEPEVGGWGGRFKRLRGEADRFEDAIDMVPGYDKDRAPAMATVYRWRADYQADFEARLDWCVKPRAQANHPPLPHIRTKYTQDGTVELDASASRDPDGNQLSYAWSIYPGDESAGRFNNPRAKRTVLRITPNQVEPVHVLLTVRDNGTPGLTGYARVKIMPR